MEQQTRAIAADIARFRGAPLAAPKMMERRRAVFDALRAAEGGVCPTNIAMGASLGISAAGAWRIMHNILARGLVDLAPTRRHTATGSSPRIYVTRVGTDAEFEAAFTMRGEGAPKAPSEDWRGKILAITRLAHQRGALLPPYGDIALAIGASLTTVYRHMDALIGSRAITVQAVPVAIGKPRLRVVAVAP